MMVRVIRLDGSEAWITCQHVLFHGDPDLEPALSAPTTKKGWMELIGMNGNTSLIDNSYMYEGLEQVLIYEFGRMVQNKVINQ